MNFLDAAPPVPDKKTGYSFSEACDLPLGSVAYIVKGLFKDGDIVLKFGASAVMKSFVAMDMVFHVSKGWVWHGHKTNQTGVLIVLGEGQGGYLKRMKAIQKHYGVTDAPIYVAVEPVLLDGNPDDLRNVIAEAEAALGCRIGLVVFDTFSMMLNGDENSNRDVGIAFRTLRQGLGGRAAILIHHVGHGDGNRERGAYQLRANSDCRLFVTRDEGGVGKVITVGHIKEKDDPLVQPINLGFKVVELGTDADGDPVTSIVIVATDDSPKGKPNVDESSLKCLSVLHQLTMTQPNAPTMSQWRFACSEGGFFRTNDRTNPDSEERAFRRMVADKLLANGLVEKGMARGLYVLTSKGLEVMP